MTDTARPLPSRTLPGRVAMPMLGFGTWQLRGGQAYDAVRRALDVGYRHVDTATMYRNHAEVGRALRDSGVPRDELFVTTKLPPDLAGSERRTLETSLHQLGLESVDLWLVHWPPGGEASPRTWAEFVAVREQGLTRAIGVSNYSASQMDELKWATGVMPSVNQIRWSPWEYDASVVAEHEARDVVLEGYSPFRASRLGDPVLAQVAREVGHTPAQVVLRWHVDHGFPVIPRSKNPERIASNADLGGFALSGDQLARLDALGRP
jgi:diketogulonate reductase-like aldo/keto reductase